MQPSATASIPPPNADMDLQTVQSMDWLFKKERFYLLVQFWQQRATLAEKEVTTLKEQIANNTTNNCENKEGTNMDRQTYENEIAAKDKEINQLLEEVQRLQTTVTKLKESSITQISRLEDQLEQKRQHIVRLEAKLDSQRDYDDLKRELSLLRPDLTTNPDVKSIELLLEKAKSLHHPPPQQQPPPPQQQQQQDRVRTPSSPSLSTSSTTQTTTTTTTTATTRPSTPTTIQDIEDATALAAAAAAAAAVAAAAVNANPTTTPSSIPTKSSTPTLEKSSSDPTTPNSDLLQQHPQQHQQQQRHSPIEPLINGNPRSPDDHHHHHHHNHLNNINNNNNNNNNIPISAATMCAVNSFLRSNNNNDDTTTLKSPYRFDDHHRSPFRFADDLGIGPPPGSMVGRLGESLIPKGDPMEAKLQEMLRYNMDKYATQNLDTLHIARRVRELLSIHNIGQRLFAKYILGLSQGTVSELLSKPKPWDKLTEKGRDSYRKMHAWACDEQAILLLKSLIPKKDNFSSGKDTSSMPPTFGRPDNDLTEERIAHILNEASQFQHMKTNQTTTTTITATTPITTQTTTYEDSHSNDDSKSPHGQCLSPFSRDSSQNRRLKKYENDDIPQEKVVRIYQEELAKLMGRRMDDIRNPREAFPGMFFPQLFSTGPGGQMDRTQEEIRMALDAYHREIVKLNQTQQPGQIPNLGLLALQQQALAQHQQPSNGNNNSTGGVQDLSLPKDKTKTLNGNDDKDTKDTTISTTPTTTTTTTSDDLRHSGSAFSLVRPKIEPGTTTPHQQQQQQQSSGSTASSPLSNTILPPAMTPNDEFSGSTVASPLQRMASITNSLISQPPSQPHHTSSQRPLKAVLPPITQQQFDQYNNLNTEDIVKKVKEQLSQYSISQRLFGESVLGLSQGSVSDLLARPKPWHMLTQKGREPFIRMKMFLEDDNAVHKLVASQYKIAPEKLMRTGGYGGGTSLGKPLPPTPKMLSDAAAGLINKMQENPNLLPPSLQLGPPPPSQNPQQSSGGGGGGGGGIGSTGGPPPMLLTPPGVPPHHAINLQNPEHLKKSNPSPHSTGSNSGTTTTGLPPHSPMSQHQVSLRNMHQHMSPSVYEMAALTQDLDTQVITTKIKEALLANNIGQKIFGEAVLGLSQGSVSELLSKPKPWHMLSIKGREPFIRMQLWLNDAHNIDRLQALKNERREANKRRRSSGPGAHDNSSDTSSNDTSEFYHSNSPGPGPTSAKKQRVLFSEEQKEALRLAFALDPYPNVATIEFLAGELGLSSRTITNWFHNHRMRLKQQVPHNNNNNSNSTNNNNNNSEITPTRDQQQQQGPFDPVQFRLLLNQRLLELSKERMGLSGVPLPYPPYLATNTNLAALISRGLLPAAAAAAAAADLDMSALNNVVKEQMSGLDLSMTSLKREPNDYDDVVDDDDGASNVGSEDSNISSNLSMIKTEPKEQPPQQQQQQQQPILLPPQQQQQGRSSRRKPAAPQWVNPNWEDDNKNEQLKQTNSDEVIINGVCVMQTTSDDYNRTNQEETIRIEPTPVLDLHHYDDEHDDDLHSDTSSISNDQDRDNDDHERTTSVGGGGGGGIVNSDNNKINNQPIDDDDDDDDDVDDDLDDDKDDQHKDDERWDY